MICWGKVGRALRARCSDGSENRLYRLPEQMRCHRIPTRCIPCQRVNWSTGQLMLYQSSQPANWSTGQLVLPLSGPLGLWASEPLAREASEHSRDHAGSVFLGHRGAGRQAEPLVEKTFADHAAVPLGGSEDGLEVHGLPDGPGFDVLGLERETNLLTGDARALRINGQAGEPMGRLTPRGFRLHGHAGERFERLGISLEVRPTARNFAREAQELPEADAGGDITEAIVVADDGMLIVGRGIARLGGEEARLISQTSIIRDQHAPAASGDDFIAVEGMDAEKAE